MLLQASVLRNTLKVLAAQINTRGPKKVLASAVARRAVPEGTCRLWFGPVWRTVL